MTLPAGYEEAMVAFGRDRLGKAWRDTARTGKAWL
jgi:hypothetical protein